MRLFAASEIVSRRHERLYHGGPIDSITAAQETLFRRHERLSLRHERVHIVNGSSRFLMRLYVSLQQVAEGGDSENWSAVWSLLPPC